MSTITIEARDLRAGDVIRKVNTTTPPRTFTVTQIDRPRIGGAVQPDSYVSVYGYSTSGTEVLIYRGLDAALPVVVERAE